MQCCGLFLPISSICLTPRISFHRDKTRKYKIHEIYSTSKVHRVSPISTWVIQKLGKDANFPVIVRSIGCTMERDCSQSSEWGIYMCICTFLFAPSRLFYSFNSQWLLSGTCSLFLSFFTFRFQTLQYFTWPVYVLREIVTERR